jgi:multidrug efflux pump subunit AcrA (membrane-fusion protein)
MKRSLWIVAFLVVVGGFAGFQQYQSWSLNKPQDNPQAPAERGGGQGRGGGRSRGEAAVPVVVATAVQKAVPVQIRAVGNVEPYATVSIKSQVTGVLQKAHFKEGQDVKSGQLLFTVDPRPLDSALKQAEAALARDSAQVGICANKYGATLIWSKNSTSRASNTIKSKPTPMPRKRW